MKSTCRLLVVIATLTVGFVRPAAAEEMPMKSELLSAYAKIADALASDDLGGAKAAAGALAEPAGTAGQKQMAEQAARISKASNISAAREQFKALSLSIEPLAAGVDGYTVMTCTMAKADWVQTAGDVRNPYYGKSMLSCGETKKSDGAGDHNHSGDKGSGHGCGDSTPHQEHAGQKQHGCG
jgi:hypothetical protein